MTRPATVRKLWWGLYAVLAFKLFLQGQPIDSGAIWSVEQKALPLVTITLVLVFAKYGLYAEREERGGSSRILSAVTVATVIVLALVLATTASAASTAPSCVRATTTAIASPTWRTVSGVKP